MLSIISSTISRIICKIKAKEKCKMKKHILCFGDSNTYGYCNEGESSDPGERFNENERWTRLLQQKLGDEYLVIEEGLNGRTTCFDDPLTEGLKGIDYISPCLRSHSPIDKLIIMLGTNDCKDRFAVSAPCIAQAMARLVRKAMDTDCWGGKKPNILVIAPPHIRQGLKEHHFYDIMGPGCFEKSRELAAYYKPQCEVLGCEFMDAQGVAEFNYSDCMHYSKLGHAQLAQALYEKLK